jgi:Domain of unknown function (DUF4136)
MIIGKKTNLLIVVVALIGLAWSPAFAAKIKVKVQSKKATDFSAYKTYAWLEHPPVARPVLALEVVGAVDEELKSRGFTKVKLSDHPDVELTFYGGVNTGINVEANDPAYASNGGVPPVGSNMWSTGSSPGANLTSIYVSKGSLIVDMIDAKGKDLVWRGVATGNIDMTTDKALQAVDEAVEKMFREYPVKKRVK